jgi:hypothetical protein
LSGRPIRPDPGRVAATRPLPDELLRLPAGTVLARVHPAGGSSPCAWDELRFFGPTTSRFDHQLPPASVHRGRGIAYATWGSSAFTAALAEFFQNGAGLVGPIDRRTNRPMITTYELARELTLLDLESGWAARAGGDGAITHGSRSRSREWARAIYRHLPVDGLGYRSSVWDDGRCVALWERAVPAVPPSPSAARLLDDPLLAPALAKAARDLGTYWV